MPLYIVELWEFHQGFVSSLNSPWKILVKNGDTQIHDTEAFHENLHWIDVDYIAWPMIQKCSKKKVVDKNAMEEIAMWHEIIRLGSYEWK